MNEELVMGGAGMDVELDEISFRSKGLDDKVLWLRYIAIVRRGSAKVFIHKLPDKLTASGQGGGGPLSIQELKDTIVNSAGASRIAVGSVCHTDSAKAMETQLHERVRTFQFLHWFSFTDAFQVFAEMRKLERASVGSVTWASLASFGKGKAKPSTAPETKSAEEVPAVLVPPAEESPQPLSLSCDEEHEPVYSEGEDVQSELFDPEEEEELIFDNKGIRVLN
ncbi:timm16 [Symbiodinium natans]|uniref:Timm16 protein n=1 Tax=Symbiodinium natans TaxID=878477 RepID=A0A812Q5B0_9DINO|nr:timm16 [Symbiodinium natans]